MGARVRLHHCGNTTHLLDGLGRLGTDFIDIDYPVDLAVAREKCGIHQGLAGNLHPVQTMKLSSPAAITAALANCERVASPWWAIGAGCEIPRGTPPENYLAPTGYGGRAALLGSSFPPPPTGHFPGYCVGNIYKNAFFGYVASG